MIKTFRCKKTHALFVDGEGGDQKWQAFARTARRKLVMLNAAKVLNDLKRPPNNKLERLTKGRTGQHAIRINDQYRICFVWRGDGADEVEIVDYH
jgi:proteic killer suppression protein